MSAENTSNLGLEKIMPKALRSSKEPANRLAVVAIWAFVTLLFVITRVPSRWRLFEFASGAAVAFCLWPFLLGPYRLHARGKLPLHLQHKILQGQFDQALAPSCVLDLVGSGFEYAGQLEWKS